MRARVRAALSNCLLSVQASEDVDGEDDEESLLLNVSHAAMSMRPPPEKQTRHTIASPIRLRLITPWRRIPDNVAGNGRRGRNKRVGAQEMQMTADLRRGLPSNSRLKSPPPRRLTPRYLSCAHSSSAHVKRRRGGGRGGGGGGWNLKSKSLESEESDLLCSRSKILKREREAVALLPLCHSTVRTGEWGTQREGKKGRRRGVGGGGPHGGNFRGSHHSTTPRK